jgi:hypothetical protein
MQMHYLQEQVNKISLIKRPDRVCNHSLDSADYFVEAQRPGRI